MWGGGEYVHIGLTYVGEYVHIGLTYFIANMYNTIYFLFTQRQSSLTLTLTLTTIVLNSDSAILLNIYKSVYVRYIFMHAKAVNIPA